MEPIGDVALGRNVVENQGLQALRLKLGLTVTAMAELLATSPVTYKGWENTPKTELWPTTAARIGRFYKAVHGQLALLSADGVDLSTLTPMPQVANKLGLANEVMLAWFREGAFQAHDLGILGLWLEDEDIEAIRVRSRKLPV